MYEMNIVLGKHYFETFGKNAICIKIYCLIINNNSIVINGMLFSQRRCVYRYDLISQPRATHVQCNVYFYVETSYHWGSQISLLILCCSLFTFSLSHVLKMSPIETFSAIKTLENPR